MPFATDNFIHLPNPDHPESDFRKNNKGSLNIVGTTNFGAGIKARMGLLLGTGKSAVAVYLFDTKKYTMATAKVWLKNHKSKEFDNMKGESFEVFLPLKKGYENKDDGFYYLEYGLSTTAPDFEKDEMTEPCIDDMIHQVTQLNSFKSHDYSKVVGPFVDAWKERKDDHTLMMVKVRVKPSMRKDIEEDVDTGVRQGGSIGGNVMKKYMEGDIRKIEKVQLLEGSLTPMPMNWETLGTARGGINKSKCPHSICGQILKSIDAKGYQEEDMTKIDKLEKCTEDLHKAITMLPGWPEDLDSVIASDKAQLMSLLGSVVESISTLVEDMIDEEMSETPEQEAKEEMTEAT